MSKQSFISNSVSFLERRLSSTLRAFPLQRQNRVKESVRHGRWKHFRVKHFRGDAPRVRVRVTPLPKTTVKCGEIWKRNVNGIYQLMTVANIPNSVPFSSCEKTQDVLNPGPPYTTGGPFTSIKMNMLPLAVGGVGTYTSAVPINIGFGSGIHQYRGGFSDPQFIGVDYSDAQYRDQKFIFGELTGFVPPLSAWHTMVDKRLRPKLNVANLGQSLVELREIPEMLRRTSHDLKLAWDQMGGHPRSMRLSPSGIADSWLNIQFGWRPFLQDIHDVCKVVVNYDLYIADISSRNGKWERRHSVLEDVSTEEIVGSGLGYKVSPSGFLIDQFCSPSGTWTSRYTYTRRIHEKVWCSGDYTFYKPSFDMSRSDYDSGLNQIKRLSTLLGTDISPSLVWKVTPWTWLVDWFSNVGSMIEAADAAAIDGVISKNVFLMMRRTQQLVLKQEINFASGPIEFEFVRNVESKQRGKAETPFNFGLLPTDLSAKQWSILAALGISRRPLLSIAN